MGQVIDINYPLNESECHLFNIYSCFASNNILDDIEPFILLFIQYLSCKRERAGERAQKCVHIRWATAQTKTKTTEEKKERKKRLKVTARRLNKCMDGNTEQANVKLMITCTTDNEKFQEIEINKSICGGYWLILSHVVAASERSSKRVSGSARANAQTYTQCSAHRFIIIHTRMIDEWDLTRRDLSLLNIRRWYIFFHLFCFSFCYVIGATTQFIVCDWLDIFYCTLFLLLLLHLLMAGYQTQSNEKWKDDQNTWYVYVIFSLFFYRSLFYYLSRDGERERLTNSACVLLPCWVVYERMKLKVNRVSWHCIEMQLWDKILTSANMHYPKTQYRCALFRSHTPGEIEKGREGECTIAHDSTEFRTSIMICSCIKKL